MTDAATQAAANQSVTLYVANATIQNAVLHWRTAYNDDGSRKDENRRFEAYRQTPIAPGQQTVLGARQMPMVMAMEIVTQLSRHGLTDAEDVKKTRGKCPFVYNFNRPVPVDVIRMARERNAAILLEEGRVRRKRAAVAVNDLIVQVAATEAAKQGREEMDPPNVRVSVEQLDQSEAGERRIEEGYKVDAAAEAPGRGPAGAGRRGNRGRRGG